MSTTARRFHVLYGLGVSLYYLGFVCIVIAVASFAFGLIGMPNSWLDAVVALTGVVAGLATMGVGQLYQCIVAIEENTRAGHDTTVQR